MGVSNKATNYQRTQDLKNGEISGWPRGIKGWIDLVGSFTIGNA